MASVAHVNDLKVQIIQYIVNVVMRDGDKFMQLKPWIIEVYYGRTRQYSVKSLEKFFVGNHVNRELKLIF